LSASTIRLQESYQNWISLRKVSLKLFEDIFNARGKLSHCQQKQILPLKLAISSHPTSLQIFDEISQLFVTLYDIQNRMHQELEKISALQSEYRSLLPFDDAYLEVILESLQQETALEITLSRRISGSATAQSGDHDISITIMACLTYPPYFRKDDVQKIFEFGSKKR
jgi:hypothetical protein